MTDHLDRAAAIVGGCCAHCAYLVPQRLALLNEAGLLVSPERDAEQRRAGAVEALGEVRAALRAEVVIRDYEQRNVSRADLWALAGQFTPDWLDSLRADRIEREAGESDAER